MRSDFDSTLNPPRRVPRVIQSDHNLKFLKFLKDCMHCNLQLQAAIFSGQDVNAMQTSYNNKKNRNKILYFQFYM